MPPFIDMTGIKYGRLTAIERVKNSRYGQTMWLFRCECGKEIVTTGFAVRSGHTTSCGCYLSEKNCVFEVFTRNGTNKDIQNLSTHERKMFC